MTPEQLEQIEKLAAAATPGPWPTTGWVEDPHGVPYGTGKDILDGEEEERIAQAERDTAFIGAMREHALPLVKALREAREERDVLQAVLNDWQRFGMDREKERDAARAEVERLNEMLRAAVAERDEDRADLFTSRRANGRIINERDEARAEVERLRAAITRFVNQYPWQHGTELQELKALKDSDQ